MRYFLIGATGYIGRVVAEKLQGAGHAVVGLARTLSAARTLRESGVEPVRGEIEAPGGLARAALRADGTIYVADAGSFSADRRAVEALLAAYEDTGKLLIFTSGSAVFADAAAGERSEQVFDEETPPSAKLTPPAMLERVLIEREVLDAKARGVRGVVMRPPLVYGRGGSIQVPLLIDIAWSTGAARYVGAGENVWSTVHVDDLAGLYVLASRHAPPGDLFHAASGEETMRDLAGAVGRLLGLGPPVSWSPEEARARGSFAAGLGSNSRISANKARDVLGWKPEGPSAPIDIEHGSYRVLLQRTAKKGAW